MYAIDPSSYSEICRYMGVHSLTEDPQLTSLIARAAERVGGCAVPRSVSRVVDTVVSDAEVRYAEVVVRSADLASHLRGCDKVVLFAATLGSDVDRLIERDSLLQPSLAVAEQATATVLIEQYADECCRSLAEDVLRDGYHLTPRFSPGYGDCSLTAQTELLRLLDASRRIGLTLTDHYMMAPIKSVSAWTGLTKELSTCYGGGCCTCRHTTCQFRKADVCV